jgi:hypothetical protein
MGGSGSGNWYRYNKKSTTSRFHRWDIQKLVKSEVIKIGQCRTGSWQWYVEGDNGVKDVRATIGYIASITDGSFPYIQVQYQNQNSKDSFDYKINLTTTNPQYGGKRWWFICPLRGCSRRVGVLYLTGTYFGCRRCLKLAYESQNEAPHSRMLTKAQKIYYKLGGKGGIDWVPRPKGMHQKTYDKLIAKMEEYDRYSWTLAAKHFRLLDGI